MKYVGINTQIWRNNIKSVLLLILFPIVVLELVWLFIFFIQDQNGPRLLQTNYYFMRALPFVVLAVVIWFIIAWFYHSEMIEKATGSAPLNRNDNKRVYNLVENLCISCGMAMPKIDIIDDDSLNAFASGMNSSSFTISLSKGIIDKLNDEELEGVIAHELSHIRNRDVRLLIVSVIFVGIFSFLTMALLRSIRFTGGGNRSKKGGAGYWILVALALAALGYLLSSLFRFALSKNREYMADAGSAMITKNPLALASALEKISVDSRIEAVSRQDVAQLFIDNPRDKKMALTSLFATHPPIEKRIELLRQF
jgi:heat shock protein HtpX